MQAGSDALRRYMPLQLRRDVHAKPLSRLVAQDEPQIKVIPAKRNAEMGESTNPRATLRFDRRVRLEFRGATITSDAGLLACRELDDALGLTETANEYLQESRGGRNVQHRLVGLLRQSVYSRLAGYEDTNDAERLAQDPTMRIIVGRRDTDRPA